MNNFEYRVYEEVLNDMINGTKKVEIRLYNEKSSKIKINDIIKFKNINDESKYILVKVTSLTIYNDIDDLMNRYCNNMNAGKYNKETFTKGMYDIFGKDEVDNHKIIGIEFALL